MLSTASSVSVAPDGNGGLYAAIRQSPSTAPSSRTVLQDMHARGIQYIHAYCVDNCLVKVADPVFLGYCIEKGAACGAKVVRKEDPHESVGVLAMRDGAFSVVEYSELSKEKAEQRDQETGELAYRAANIANHFYTLDFLDQVESMEAEMAFHIARKKIPTVDLSTGKAIKPDTPNGMKLELFVFDVFPFTKTLGVLEVPRQEEFSPLKNAPGSKSDNPETSRRDIYGQQKRWLQAAGADVKEGVEVEVSPLVSYNGEGLEKYKGKVFESSTQID
jgi:UDP-N-acetylglucosamine/UDP-N-acetylgalactosamine diphosphorylase